MYQWVVFVHVASVITFMLAHGVHVAAMWAMRGEPDPERMLTFFNIVPTATVLRILLAILVLSGALAGFMGGWWSSGWIWTSLALLAAIAVTMWRYGGGYFGQLQEAAEAAIEARTSDPSNPAPGAAYDVARRAWEPIGLTVIGFGGVGVILWLMMFKPF